VEKRAVRDAALQAGARDVYLIEEPTAAAIGAGLPIHEPGGHLIVDIGGGTTEVAVISMSGTVYCNSVRIAGDEMDEAIIQHIRKHYRLLVGERRAEEIKIALGSAHPEAMERSSIEVKGRDLVDGVPKTLVITDEEIREALREPAMTIVETVRTCLQRTPPELAADIIEKGVVLAGGGALLRGMDWLLQHVPQLPVRVAEDPLSCAARGAGKALDNVELLRKVAIPACSPSRRRSRGAAGPPRPPFGGSKRPCFRRSPAAPWASAGRAPARPPPRAPCRLCPRCARRT